MALTKTHNRMIEGAFLNVKDFGAVGDGVADDSTAIQSAIDKATANDGGIVFLPDGHYKCNVTLKEGVHLTSFAQMYGNLGVTQNYIVKMTAASGGVVIDTPTTAIKGASVSGINIFGLGASTALVGIRFRDVSYGAIRNCHFANFADQAILINAQSGACVVEDVLCFNTLLNRTRSSREGCIEISGVDCFLSRVEANPSLTAVTDSNLRVCGIYADGANTFMSNCVGEFADIGIAIDAAFNSRIDNCRADLNWGHGFYNNGRAQYSNCTALNNSRDTTNTYDGFNVTGQQASFSNCLATHDAGSSLVHRYGFKDDNANVNADSRNYYYGCRSKDHGTAAFDFAATEGSSAVEAPVPTNTTSATPSTESTTFLVFTHSSATDVTNFTGGYTGKRIFVRGSSNATIKNNATIKTNTGSDKTLVSDRIYSFMYYNGVWQELQ